MLKDKLSDKLSERIKDSGTKCFTYLNNDLKYISDRVEHIIIDEETSPIHGTDINRKIRAVPQHNDWSQKPQIKKRITEDIFRLLLEEGRSTKEIDDAIRKIHREIFKYLVAYLFKMIFNACTKDSVIVSDTKKHSEANLNPEQDGVKTITIQANIAGKTMLDTIYNQFIVNNINDNDEITLIVPESAFYMLKKTFDVNSVNNTLDLLLIIIPYNNIKFYVFAENKEYFLLPNDGVKTTGIAFVKNRMVLHKYPPDYWKSIFALNPNSDFLYGDTNDILAMTLDKESLSRIIVCVMDIHILRGCHNAAAILEFTNSEIDA